MSRTASELAFLARAMKAPRIAACAESMAKRAAEEGWDHQSYLAAVLGEEVAARETHGGQHRVKAARFPQVKTLDDIITSDELATLATGIGVDYAPMVFLGAVLGLRWGECAGLRVGRLDFLRSTLAVAEQVTRGPKGATVIGPPKSAAGRRTLSVPKPLMDMLAAHLARRGVTGARADAFVFTAPNGGPLDYSHFRRRAWLPACRSAKLEGLAFHDLRRANATEMVAEGVDLKTAQNRLGHSDPRMTLAVYAQATSGADRAAANRMGERFMTRHERAMESDSRGGQGPASLV